MKLSNPKLLVLSMHTCFIAANLFAGPTRPHSRVIDTRVSDPRISRDNRYAKIAQKAIEAANRAEMTVQEQNEALRIRKEKEAEAQMIKWIEAIPGTNSFGILAEKIVKTREMLVAVPSGLELKAKDIASAIEDIEVIDTLTSNGTKYFKFNFSSFLNEEFHTDFVISLAKLMSKLKEESTNLLKRSNSHLAYATENRNKSTRVRLDVPGIAFTNSNQFNEEIYQNASRADFAARYFSSHFSTPETFIRYLNNTN